MTYHSHSSWTFDDEPNDAVVDEIVSGLTYNKEYNGGECYTPSAYWTSCPIDSLILHIGRLLDQLEHQGDLIPADAIEDFTKDAPEPAKVVVLGVFERLGVLNG